MEEAYFHISRYFGHIASKYNAFREKRVAQFGVGRSDLPILHQLALHNRPMHLGEIAMRTMSDRALIGRAAKHLAELGYIAFQDNPFHKTKKDVVLTEAGRQVANEVLQATLDWEKGAESLLTPAERESLYAMLDKVYQASSNLE